MAAGHRVPMAWFRKALAQSMSDESRTRLGRVLTQLEKNSDPNQWRMSRAVHVLELSATDAAKALLESWAIDGAGNALSIDARAAWKRFQH